MMSQNVGNQRWSLASGGKQSLTEVADCNPAAGEAMPLACGPVKEVKDWGRWGTALGWRSKRGDMWWMFLWRKIRGVKTQCVTGLECTSHWPGKWALKSLEKPLKLGWKGDSVLSKFIHPTHPTIVNHQKQARQSCWLFWGVEPLNKRSQI